jgi:4-amino-4-deoxy-L-arabinose transferase-like glycosyltransferase
MAKQVPPRPAVRAAAPRSRRPTARPGARPYPVPRWLASDLLILLCLAIPWLALVGYVAATPPSRVAFNVAEPPDKVILRSYYGVERNAAGAFRWAKPESSISLPLAAPATYAITLTLQDSPAVPAPRAASVYANGRAIGTATLGPAPQQYRFVVPLQVGEWGGENARMLHIELAADPFLPPGDPRALGPIVAAVAVAPVETIVAWPLVLGGALALLAGIYALLRLLELSAPVVVGFAGAGMALYGLAALADRSAALALTYRPVTQPLAFAALIAGVLGLPLLGGAGTARFAGSAPRGAATVRRGLRLTREQVAVAAALAGIVALGLGLRLYRLQHLSLWLDENSTIYFARFSWPRVLGLEGWYDNHPPLYFALIKLVTTLIPEIHAARLTSAVAGAATLPVLAVLGARLVNWRAGLIAALVLAISPLHIWYSQEARMYAPVVLLVLLSYLALVAFAQTTRRAWAVAYGVSVALALYIDYSAIYALAPQAVALLLITRRWRRRALPIWGTSLGAICCFLPWVPNILTSIDTEGRNRESFLGVSTGKVNSVALSVLGLKNEGNYLWGTARTSWERAPVLFAFLLAGLGVAALIGAVILARRSPLGLVIALGLLIGTFVAAILVSLISPGFAERTVLAATAGWALLLGVAAGGTWRADAAPRRLPRWYNAVALVGIALMLFASVGSLRAIYQGATKEDNRALAAAAAQGARTGVPVIAQGWLAAGITAYHPGLPVRTDAIVGEVEQFWWAYGEYAWVDVAGQRTVIERLGYVRLMHRQYAPGLYLDYYTRPGALLPGATPLDLAAAGGDWGLPPGASRDSDGTVHLAGPDRATLTIPGRGEGHYLLAVDAADAVAALGCRDAAGAPLANFRTVPTAEGLWLAALCPADTASLEITLRTEQPGGAEFRALRAWRVAAPTGAATR